MSAEKLTKDASDDDILEAMGLDSLELTTRMNDRGMTTEDWRREVNIERVSMKREDHLWIHYTRGLTYFIDGDEAEALKAGRKFLDLKRPTTMDRVERDASRRLDKVLRRLLRAAKQERA